MPYYGDHLAGDPGLFGKIFKGLKKIRLGSIIGHAVLPALGFRPASPAPGVVSAVQTVRSVAGTGVKVSAERAGRIRRTGALVSARGKAISPFERRRRALLAQAGRR